MEKTTTEEKDNDKGRKWLVDNYEGYCIEGSDMSFETNYWIHKIEGFISHNWTSIYNTKRIANCSSIQGCKALIDMLNESLP